MKKLFAGLTVGLVAAVFAVPAEATTYPAFKITSTVIGPGPLKLVVHQLDATHTAITLKDAKRVVNGRTSYVLRHLVCRSNSTWRLPTRAVGSCGSVSSYGFVYWRTRHVAEVKWSGTRYECAGPGTVVPSTKTFTCLLTDPNAPRASHGMGTIVYNGVASANDVPLSVVSLDGSWPAASFFGPDGYAAGSTTPPLWITVTNGTPDDVVVNTIYATSVTSNDDANCPASWFTITPLEADMIVPANTTTGWLFATINFAPTTTVNPSACQHAMITINVASN